MQGACCIRERRPKCGRDDGASFFRQLQREASVSVCEFDFQGLEIPYFSPRDPGILANDSRIGVNRTGWKA